MWIEFKDYQGKAIDKLKREINELLDADGNKICIFKSPTGSGKTLMMAEFLKRLIDSRVDGKKFSFIWIAVNKLHDQSRNSLKKYYDQFGIGLKCSYFEDLDDRKIGENEILFLNWASINKDENIYVRDNERDNNLSKIVERTRDEGRIIILIIDESHHTAGSTISREIIDDLNPKITIEVSATPQIDGDYKVTVELSKVRDQGMIKNEIVVNPGLKNYIIDKKKSDQTADEIILKSAINKRIELRQKFQKEGSSVNPLLLIQLPDNRQGIPDKKEEVLKLLAKYKYTTDNGRLAIYLTGKESKINLDNIEKNENEVEIMLFKQAIAIGWDCPRASILVLFRQWSKENITFSIQTLGRIMRMPEHFHYKDPDLNIAYVFTSLSDINTRIDNDILPDFKIYGGQRREDYENIDLISYHSKRFREETRLSSDFVPIFLQAADELKLKSKLSLDAYVSPSKIIADGRIVDVDKVSKSIEKKGWFELPLVEVELQKAFDYFARKNLTPFAPEGRSIKRINDSIYNFFGATRDEDKWPKIQATVLADENEDYFAKAIDRAKELYQEQVGKGKHELLQNDEPWNVPETIYYDSTFVEKKYKKSIVQPYYAKTKGAASLPLLEEDSDIEIDFIEYLENPKKAKRVKWWFKNGKQDSTYFAVPYIENGVDKLFYVDFVVMLTDGSIGLFDTKGGIFAKTATERAEGLAKYIETENKNGKKLLGGIVVKKQGIWHINDKKKYAYNPENLGKDWKPLDLNS